MAIVKKLNSELTISDSLVNEYLDMGYSLLDDNGNIVKEKKKDRDLIKELNEAINELESENISLKETISTLESEIYALKSSHNSSNEVSDEVTTKPFKKNTRANNGG